jgi:hypothetical protein
MAISNDPIWIDIDCTGETTNERYFGRFQVKRFLTNKEKAEVYRIASTISVGIQNIKELELLHNLAFLSLHVLTTDSTWWKSKDGDLAGMDLFDERPVLELSNQIYMLQNPPKEEAK